MGLDTRGFGYGLTQGMQVMQQQLDMKDRKARQSELDAEARSNRDREFGLREDMFQQRVTQAERQHTRQTEQDKATAEYRGQMLGLQQAQGKRAADNHKAAIADRTEQKDQDIIGSLYQRIYAGGNVDDSELKIFEKYQHLDPRHLSDPAVGQSIQHLSDGISSGNLNSQDKIIGFANSPPTLDAFNTLYATQINKGEGGHKRIAAVYPGQQPGTLVFDLEVTPENGAAYRAPVTKGRDTKGEDVLQVSIGDISEQLAGYAQFNQLTSSPAFRNRVGEFAKQRGWIKPTVKTPKTWSRLNDTTVYNSADGSTREVSGQQAGTGKPTTNKKKYNEMIGMGVPDEVARGVAYGTYKQVSDPESGTSALIDISTGQPVGAFVASYPDDPRSPMQWVQNTPTKPTSPAEFPPGDVKKILEANPGKTPEWASAYLTHLRQQGQY